MIKNKSMSITEHPHTKMVKEAASLKRNDIIALTMITGIMAGIFLTCIMLDPRNDSFKEIIMEIAKYVGGGISGGALIGFLLGEIVRREYVKLNVKYDDKQRLIIKQGKKRIKEKEIPQGTFWGEHKLGDNSLLREYDEWLMRR